MKEIRDANALSKVPNLSTRCKDAREFFYKECPSAVMTTLYNIYPDLREDGIDIVQMMFEEYISYTEKERASIVENVNNTNQQSKTKKTKKVCAKKLPQHPKQSYLERTLYWLYREYPDLYRVNLECTSALLCGDPQSGKSEFTFAIALAKVLLGSPCIFLCRNYIADATHMEAKVKRFAEKHLSFMHKSHPNINRTLETVYAGDVSINIQDKGTEDENEMLINYEHIEDALNGDKKMVVVLANGHQLHAINRLLRDGEVRPVVFIDEADAVAYSEEQDPSPRYHRPSEMAELIEHASQVFEISATVWDILAGNENLLNRNIVRITPSPSYKGCLQVEYIALEHKLKSWKPDTSLYEEDPNLEQVLREMKNAKPFEAGRHGRDHPVICLFKTKHAKAHHKAFYNELKTNPEHRKTWIVVTECYEGIAIFADCLRGKSMTVNGSTVVDKSKSGEFFFKNKQIIIPQLLQWFRDNGDVSKFHHIIIKSGAFSGRSRSYVSTDGVWHLTHEYYGGAGNAASLLQDQRILHNRPDAIPLTQYAHKSVVADIKNAYMLQKEQIDRLMDLQYDVLTAERVREEEWTKEKVPKVKLCVGSVNREFKATKVECDEGKSIDKYQDEHKKTRNFRYQHNAQERHKQHHRHSENVDGEWRKVERYSLGKKSQEYFDRFVEILSAIDAGVYRKSDIISRMTKNQNEHLAITSTSWNWHIDTAKTPKWIPAEPSTEGLLFQQEADTWYVMFNPTTHH